MTESELLFTTILNSSRDRLYLDKDYILSRSESQFLAEILKRRIQGEPIQYILGQVEFMGLEFRVAPAVFIPRPETEILVETAIEIGMRGGSQLRVLDIGTGSGCIAISLAKFLPNAKITAVDISNDSLQIARYNAMLNNVEINFLQSNLFSNCVLQDMDFELIVSNPPYIPTAEIVKLDPELDYEPHIALEGGRDGLDFYRCIIKEIPMYLKKHGFLVLEIGFGQYPPIKNLFSSVKGFEIVKVIQDYNNIDRVLVLRYG